jgi:hypothetical protein
VHAVLKKVRCVFPAATGRVGVCCIGSLLGLLIEQLTVTTGAFEEK